MKILLVCMVLGMCYAAAAPAAGASAALQALEPPCRGDFQGIEYCTADNGQTHILRVDLTKRQVHFDVATASDARRPTTRAWSPSYRQIVAWLAAAYSVQHGIPLSPGNIARCDVCRHDNRLMY